MYINSVFEWMKTKPKEEESDLFCLRGVAYCLIFLIYLFFFYSNTINDAATAAAMVVTVTIT